MQNGFAWRPDGRRLLELAAEILLIGLALPLYYLVRGFTHERVAVAIDHAHDLIALEMRLGVFWEAELQELVLSHGWLVDALNSVYVWGHQPVILAVAVWLYVSHRRHYLLMRNAFLISGAIGLVVYATYPLAPPRLLDGFEDTVFSQYGVTRVANPDFFRNEYAAMPSLHFGWNLLAGIAMWLASRNLALRAFAVAMPAAVSVSVVLTANHYVLDVVAGALTVGVGLALAVWLHGLVQRRRIHTPVWGWLSWIGGVTPLPAARA